MILKKIILVFVCVFFVSGIFADSEEDMFVKKGYAAYKKGNYQEAVDAFDEVLYINPDNLHALRYTAMSYLKLGDKESALLNFERVYYLHPNPKIKKMIDDLKSEVRGGGQFMAYPVTFEIHAAFVYTMPIGEDIDLYNSLYSLDMFSFSGLGFISYNFCDWFALTSGLIYAQKSGTLEDDSTYDYYAFRGNYLHVPIVADFRIESGWSDSMMASLGAGFYLGFGLSGEFLSGSPPPDPNGMNRTENGFLIQAGTYYYFGSVALVVKELFMVSFSDIYPGYDAKFITSITSIGINF